MAVLLYHNGADKKNIETYKTYMEVVLLKIVIWMINQRKIVEAGTVIVNRKIQEQKVPEKNVYHVGFEPNII